jgi:hypothetical protein
VNANAQRRLNILVLSSFTGDNANVIRDYLFSFRVHSRHRVYYVFDPRAVGGRLDLSPFDVIVLFWSLYLLGPDVDAALRERIRRAPALKVLFLQDEYRDVRPFNSVMAELGVNVMFSCVAETDHEIFYPRKLIPSLEAVHSVLTGYVPTYLSKRPPDLNSSRPIDIGYRSREVPFYLGDLGREKKIIADRFIAIAAEAGFTADISTREQQRLYGRRWVEFLRASRLVLGSASGASVIDFTGEIRQNCERHVAFHPDATYEEVKARFFEKVDWDTVIDTISPRVFESAALGCTLVHHEGGYAGIIEADVHYIRVRRDYSNIADVVARIRDRAFCRSLAARTYEDLIVSGRYGYGAFVRRFDDIVSRHARVTGPVRPPASWRFYARHFRRQPLVPCGATYTVLPSPALAHLALKRALSPVLRGRGLLWRLVDDPSNFVTKFALGTRRILADASLRRILTAYRRCPDVRRALPLHVLVNDIVKIDIVARALRGDLCSEPSFGIGLHYDTNARILTISSVPASGDEVLRMPDGLETALRAGAVRVVLWDHSTFPQEIVYRPDPRRARTAVVGIGTGGLYRFETLAMLCQQQPAVVAPALLSLLHPRHGTSEQS